MQTRKSDIRMMNFNLEELKAQLCDNIRQRVADRIIEQTNADLLIKLINRAESETEAMNIAALGTTYKRTGFHFDKRLELTSNDIKYKKRNDALSFAGREGSPKHQLIIGDNYDALQNLLITHKGKVDMIYIDPPYGKDNMGEFAQTNYDNAITRDNLLSMLYPRLQMAKRLLTDEGVIFCSIDDKNQAYVKCLFDEVFGEENFVGNLPTIMNLKGNQDEFGFAGTHEYTIVYSKNKNSLIIGNLPIDEDEMSDWDEDAIGYYKKGATLKRTGNDAPKKNRPYGFFPILIHNKTLEVKTINTDEFIRIYNPNTKSFDMDYVDGLRVKYEDDGYTVLLPETEGQDMSWRWSRDKVEKETNEIIVVGEKGNFSLYKKQRPQLGDLPSKKPKSTLYKPEYSSGNGTAQLKSILDGKVFDNPKPVDLIKDFVLLTSKSDSIILDFFAGSGTTGQAVMELNREDGGSRTFILCTNNEVTEANPNGIARDVTSKRLKRVMTGECYDGTKDFPWLKNNEPYGDGLEVYEIDRVSKTEMKEGETAFDKIDERCYGMEKFESVVEKIKWVCGNFENATKFLEGE